MQERFMVRTIIFADGSWSYQNTLAEGRPDAIKQAERIGPFEDHDRRSVRFFLEDLDPNGRLPFETFKCLDLFAKSEPTGHSNVASIYRID